MYWTHTARSRHINFSISLHILLGMILLVVPLVQCLMFTYRSRGKQLQARSPLMAESSVSASTRGSSLTLTTRLLVALIPFSLYIFLFTRIPPYVTAVASAPIPALDDGAMDGADEGVGAGPVGTGVVSWTEGPEGWEGEGWLASSLGRVVVLGVVVLGALSGFGALRTALNFFENIHGGIGSVSIPPSRRLAEPWLTLLQVSVRQRHHTGRTIVVSRPPRPRREARGNQSAEPSARSEQWWLDGPCLRQQGGSG